MTETGAMALQDRKALADLAFALGAKYANRRLSDLEAARDHWGEVCAAGLSACSLPARYGGAGGMSELLLIAERLAAGGPGRARSAGLRRRCSRGPRRPGLQHGEGQGL